MRAYVFLSLIVTLLAASGCEKADPCPGEVECGQGCMPIGSSCCPNGSSYCRAGYYCGGDNLCHTAGGGGGGNTCSAYTCINNLCSPGLWCCPSGHSCKTSTCGCN